MNIVNRKNLFYNRYQYRVRFKHADVSIEEINRIDPQLLNSGNQIRMSLVSCFSCVLSYEWYKRNIENQYTMDVAKWVPNYSYKSFEHHAHEILYTNDINLVMHVKISIPELIRDITEVNVSMDI